MDQIWFFLLNINFKPLIIDSMRRFFSSLSFHSEIDSEASPGRLPPTACPSVRTDVLGFGSLNRDLSLNDRSQYRSSIAPCDRRRRPDGQFFFFTATALNVTPRTQCVPDNSVVYNRNLLPPKMKKAVRIQRSKPIFLAERLFDDRDAATTLSHAPHDLIFFSFQKKIIIYFSFHFSPLFITCFGVPAPAATHVVFSATRLRRRGFLLPTKKRK